MERDSVRRVQQEQAVTYVSQYAACCHAVNVGTHVTRFLPQRARVHLLHKHDPAMCTSFTAGTVPEIFDRPSYKSIYYCICACIDYMRDLNKTLHCA